MKDVARYFVHGVDRENVGAQLDGFAERHWDYMDAHSERLVARGPTLFADRTSHTGSVHVVGAASMEDASQGGPITLANRWSHHTGERHLGLRRTSGTGSRLRDRRLAALQGVWRPQAQHAAGPLAR